jgi:hypothetical protein
MSSSFRSQVAFLIAWVHVAVLAAPSLAFAQAAKPVPYNPAPAPVPYGQPSPSAGSAGGQSGTRALVAPAGSDVIYLKNGGILRGTIIDAIPNAQARIQLATGEIATVPWSEIARFEHGGTPAPTPASPPAATQAATQAAPSKAAAQPGLVVHVDSPSPVELQYKGEGEDDSWRTVCSSPCDRHLPTEGHFRIVGDGARSSRSFMLPEGNGTVTLSVNPSSQGWFVGGIVLTAVGAPTMLVGLLIGLVASLATTVDTSGTAQDWATGGWTTFGLGLAGLVVGIIAIVGNAHTGVDIQSGSAKDGALGSPWAPLNARALEATPHVAVFRDPPPESRAAPAAGATLLKLSF